VVTDPAAIARIVAIIREAREERRRRQIRPGFGGS
jgi:hypothetical protein